MKIFPALFSLCAVILIYGCNTCKQESRYISEITVIPDKISDIEPVKCFNVYVDLKKKTGKEVTTIPLPPLAVTHDSSGLALVKTNVEGLEIKYSVDVIERKELYNVLQYKLDILDGQAKHHEERLITVKKEENVVKSFSPAANKSISETKKENPEAVQKAIQNKTFSINVDQDFYNPAICSIEWLFSYPALMENQYINLHFEIYDRLHNKLVDSFDNKIITGRKKGSFNLLVSVKAPNSELSFTSPDGNFTYQSSLANIILVKQRIKSLKNIETTINEKTLLARMEPVPSQSLNQPEYHFKDLSIVPAQQLTGREKALNYDIYITPELKQSEQSNSNIPHP